MHRTFKIQYTLSISCASGARHVASNVSMAFTGMIRARLSAGCALTVRSRFAGAIVLDITVDCDAALGRG